MAKVAEGLTHERESRYTPRGAAAKLLACRDGEVVLEGPAGTGKSRATLEKLYRCALRYPGMRGLMVRKTRVSMTQSTLVTWETEVVDPESPALLGPQRSHRGSYTFPNGSEVVVAGIDKPSRIMSSQYDFIVVPEATELFEHDWEMLTTRMRNGAMPYDQITADINPDAPTHWIHQRTDSGKATVFFSRHEDNPTLFDAERGEWTARGERYIAILDKLTGVRYERLRHGRRVGAEGAVYPFDRRVHLVDRFKIPEDWPRYRSIDFGFNDPLCCQWWAADPDSRLILYREIYRTGRTMEQHAPQIARLSSGEKYVATFADHDPDKRATLAKHGIHTTKAYKPIEAGIEAVRDRMAVAADGRPRLVLMRDSLVERDEALAARKQPVCTEQEFDAYLYPKTQDGRPMKEVPIDAFNHGMDATRYLVMGYERLGGGRKGSLGVLPWEA